MFIINLPGDFYQYFLLSPETGKPASMPRSGESTPAYINYSVISDGPRPSSFPLLFFPSALPYLCSSLPLLFLTSALPYL